MEDNPMSEQRIILAHETKFLRTTLRRLITKANNLRVVAEVDNLDEIAHALAHTQADWMVLSLPEDHNLAPEILDELQRHSQLRALAVSGDGSQMQMEWIERRNHETSQFSVQEFMEIFSEARTRD
jgi:DNA-binding NarL/FixJ family response regulator